MAETDPLGQAMLDYQRGGLRGECIHRDGATIWDADIHENYFKPPEDWHETTPALLDSLAGPVCDVGCGAGQHALWLQEHGREIVGIDRSPGAIEAATERGVNDARVMDMFELEFPRDRFRSALVVGTQIGLAGSLAGVAAFCRDLAYVTDERGVAVVHNYDPDRLDSKFAGYRPDPRRGVARRTFHVEYERDGEREVGRTLDFILFGPNRLREAIIGTSWRVADVSCRESTYKAVLKKSRSRQSNA